MPGRLGLENLLLILLIIRDNLDSCFVDRYASEGKPLPTYGTVVEVISIKTPDPTKCKMLILDPLGNVVVDDLPAYPKANDPNTFYFFWDGYNRNNRVVGSGTYLARIFVYAEGESQPGVKQQKIGVRN